MMMQPVMRTCFEVYVLNIPVLGGGGEGNFSRGVKGSEAFVRDFDMSEMTSILRIN